MEMGFGLPVSGAWATPANIREVATTAERLGYTTLWSFQRLTVPVDEAGTPQLPPAYGSVLDPLVPLGFAAAVTERIGLGTAIVNMPYQSPAVLAKGLASLDVLSGGRLVAGLGIGWLPDEFTAVGVPFERRGDRAEEYLDCLAALWTEEPVAFEGEFYTVPRSSFLPKPVQAGGPPILLGGSAARALRRAGRRTSGWISASRADLARLGESIGEVREGAREAGRDPASLRFVCRGVVRDAPRSGPLTGSLDEVRADLPALAAQGVTETFVDLNFDPAVGSPDVAPETAMRRAREVLEALAP
jgi:probable F420-dependent oxidoreductase